MTWQNGISEGQKKQKKKQHSVCLHAYWRRSVLLFTLSQKVTMFYITHRKRCPAAKISTNKITYWSTFLFMVQISSKYTFCENKLFSCPLGCHGAVSVRAECLSKAQATLSIWPHRSAISRVLLGSKSSKSLVRPEALSSTAARQR